MHFYPIAVQFKRKNEIHAILIPLEQPMNIRWARSISTFEEHTRAATANDPLRFEWPGNREGLRTNAIW